MKKVVVLARNEAESTKGSQLFPALKSKKVYPGAKRFPRHFDAIIVYHGEPNEVNFIKDDLQRYKDAPLIVFCGKSPYSGAGDYHAKTFTHDQAEALVAHLSEEYQKLEEVMRKVFMSFDKDNSGHIDIKELKDVSKELEEQ